MSKFNFSILPYKKAYRNQMLQVWEKSVLATHDFLKKNDFETIRKIVEGIDFEKFTVVCLVDEFGQVIGFLGLMEKKVEMLFLDPTWIGKGLGKLLLKYAIDSCACDEVDVNEQNKGARIFYENAGFEVVTRSEKDGAGMNYPILHMKLKSNPYSGTFSPHFLQ